MPSSLTGKSKNRKPYLETDRANFPEWQCALKKRGAAIGRASFE